MSAQDADFKDRLTDEQAAARRAGRKVEVPKPIPLAGALGLRIMERVRLDQSLTDDQKMQMYRDLPRNRREARRLLRGNGPWGLARRPR